MKLKTNSLERLLMPSHFGDAGYDIVANSSPKIVGSEVLKNYYNRIDYIEYDTDLIIAPDWGVHTYVFPRSSVSKTSLILANSVGLIDNEYRGTVKLRFKYIMQPSDLSIIDGNIVCEVNLETIYDKGDKIGQLVFAPTIILDLETTDKFELTSRNEGGFGSTGI